MYKAGCTVGQILALQVKPIAKKLRIPQATFNAVKTKFVRFAQSFGIINKKALMLHNIICKTPGLPNGLFNTVFSNPVK